MGSLNMNLISNYLSSLLNFYDYHHSLIIETKPNGGSQIFTTPENGRFPTTDEDR